MSKYIRIKKPFLERFWNRVDKGGSIPSHVPKLGKCWNWKASKDRKGYGICHSGTYDRAHRVMWKVMLGDIPAGLCVLHKCDNPSCVNPDHLFLGTNIDNVKDRQSKGRTARGERHRSVTRPETVPRGEKSGMAKLTEKDVIEIRNSYIPFKVGAWRLGKRFGVTKQTVFEILKREIWAHV